MLQNITKNTTAWILEPNLRELKSIRLRSAHQAPVQLEGPVHWPVDPHQVVMCP